MIKFLFSCILTFLSATLLCQLSEETISKITREINQVRSNGLTCGNERMQPVNELYWNDQLYDASMVYASYMKRNNHFDHLSLEGEDAGMRLDKIGYNWRLVGENIAVGQHDFFEVLEDWIKSESHCKMLMSPDMRHFAVARNEKYWVQTFATPMR